MIRRAKIYFILVLIIIFSAGLTNYIWLRDDNSIAGVDSPNHLLFSIDFFYATMDIIHNINFSPWLKIVNIIKLLGRPLYGDIYWPNGLNLTVTVFYSFLGKSLLSAKLSLLPYLFILLFSTYLIGSLVFSEFIGLLATFILFMYPLIFTSSRQYQLDFPLTAMVALNILFILKSDNFKNKKYSFFFGISLGWAMLIKGQVILFILWPICFVLYKLFKNPREGILRSKQLENIAIFFIAAALIASIWWGHQIEAVENSLREHIFSAWKATESSFSWNEKYSFAALSFYFREFFKSFGSVFLVSFLISLLFFVKEKIKHKAIFLGWLVVPFLLFSFLFTIKHSRFLMPVAPAMALITSWGMQQIRIRKLRLLIVFIVFMFGLVQFYVISWCGWNRREMSIGPFKIFGKLGLGADYEADPPHNKNLKIDEVVRLIRKHAPSLQLLKIGSISCSGRPNTLETLYWLKIEDRYLYPIDLLEMHNMFLDNFASLDFIILHIPAQNTLLWPEGKQFNALLEEKHRFRIKQIETLNFARWHALLATLSDAALDFTLIGKIFKDDGDVYCIYKRKL